MEWYWIYLIVAGAVAIVTSFVLSANYATSSDTFDKWAARIIFASPVWPIILAALLGWGAKVLWKIAKFPMPKNKNEKVGDEY